MSKTISFTGPVVSYREDLNKSEFLGASHPTSELTVETGGYLIEESSGINVGATGGLGGRIVFSIDASGIINLPVGKHVTVTITVRDEFEGILKKEPING